jgi:GNAT superfamily N-acetyltransferase
VRAEFHPVTASRLPDLMRFSIKRGRFGHGKFAYCSCMRWRLKSADFHRTDAASRRSLRRLIRRGIPVGVLGYVDGEPVGWCSIAPRETYCSLERYRQLPRIDDAQVWSVVCFFVSSKLRGKGLTLGLLKAAVKYARSHGATVIEGYPVAPGPRLYTYMGSPSIFAAAGFRDVTPRGQARRVFRLVWG